MCAMRNRSRAVRLVEGLLPGEIHHRPAQGCVAARLDGTLEGAGARRILYGYRARRYRALGK